MKNQNHNYTIEIQNYRKHVESWKASHEKLEREKNEIENLLQKKNTEIERIMENNTYMLERFERERNDTKI